MALEDIVSFRSMEPLNQALEGELDAAELELFQQQLLKNFSLQSLMENLTILNPARLLDLSLIHIFSILHLCWIQFMRLSASFNGSVIAGFKAVHLWEFTSMSVFSLSGW